MRALVMIAAVVLGLVAGVFLVIFNWFAVASLFFALRLDHILGKGTPTFLLFMICVYVIWLFMLFALFGIKRTVAHLNNALLFVFVFLTVVPLPSIYGVYSMWEGCRGRQGGECGYSLLLERPPYVGT
jgi:predicted permease